MVALFLSTLKGNGVVGKIHITHLLVRFNLKKSDINVVANIAKISVTSPIVINMPARELLTGNKELFCLTF